MPLPVGSMRPMVAFAAIAASTALPPRSRIATPALAASGWLDATIPYRVATIERPTTGRACSAWVGLIASRARGTAASMRVDIRAPDLGFRYRASGPGSALTLHCASEASACVAGETQALERAQRRRSWAPTV